MHTMESKATNRNRKMTEARMHPSDSSSGVLQPTAVTNTTHPRLSTTVVGLHGKDSSFQRMWAQLKKEQGSPLGVRTLEEEYDALQPNEHQDLHYSFLQFSEAQYRLAIVPDHNWSPLNYIRARTFPGNWQQACLNLNFTTSGTSAKGEALSMDAHPEFNTDWDTHCA